jgi:hypothetical protein
MIDLRNYALLAEQKKFGYFNKLNESGPDQQSDAGLKAVLSGKTDAKYLNQWEQLVADFNKNVQTPGLHTVIINHDDGKTQMVSIDYQIGTDKKPIKGSVVLTPAAKIAAPAPKAADLLKIAMDVSTLIQDQFKDGSSLFKEFKKSWYANDEDAQAATAFDAWYKVYCLKKVTSITAGAALIPTPDPDPTDVATMKTTLTNNAIGITNAVAQILSKMRSNSDTDDDVSWSIQDFNGATTPYKVDTDI